MELGGHEEVKKDLSQISIKYHCYTLFAQPHQADRTWERYQRVALIYNNHPKRGARNVKATPSFAESVMGRNSRFWIAAPKVCHRHGIFRTS